MGETSKRQETFQAVPRYIFIGDIHGCFDELTELLSLARASEGDVVVAVGDLTRKGPAPDRCLELWLEHRYRSVLGNNDAKMLERGSKWPSRLVARPSDRRILRRRDLLQEIGRWPLYFDFPEVGVVVVHGGVLPNSNRFSPQLVPREAALELRHIRRQGDRWRMVPKGEERDGDPFWSEVWDGDRRVVYGHTPRRQAKIDRRAIGIDTGCVYGGRLTAVIFEAAEQWRLIDVAAKRAYSR
jgi:diadenosine tetraphosphatase ApaH/serine/threonine PP2A family protein phosphatase